MVAMASANLMVADLIFSLSLSKIFEVSSLSRTQCLKSSWAIERFENNFAEVFSALLVRAPSGEALHHLNLQRFARLRTSYPSLRIWISPDLICET